MNGTTKCADEGCSDRHCGCRRHLAWGDYFCPTCVHEVRIHMARAEDATAMMSAEAEHRGVDSEAAYLAGPHADPTKWQWRRINQRRAGLDADEWDLMHPGVCFGHWERELREDFGHDDEVLTSPTIAGSRAYLDTAVSLMARSEGRVLVLVEMASDMRRLCRYLEGVLRDGEQIERGVPCPECEDGGKRRLVLQRNDRDQTGARDRWVCPVDPEHWWSQAGYSLRVKDDHLVYAPELTMRDLPARVGVPAGTIRRWASRQWNRETEEYDAPLLKGRGKSSDRRTLYRVADVEALVERDTGGEIVRSA